MHPLAPCPPNSAKQFGQSRTVLKMWSIMVPKAFGEGGQRGHSFYQNTTTMLITLSTLVLSQAVVFQMCDHTSLSAEAHIRIQMPLLIHIIEIYKSVKRYHSSH